MIMPSFPIISLSASANSVFESLSAFSVVTRHDDLEDLQPNIDFEYSVVKENDRIEVGFTAERIAYIIYHSHWIQQCGAQQTEMVAWFLNHYGSEQEYNAPIETRYALYFENLQKMFSITFEFGHGNIKIGNFSGQF